MQRVLGVKIRLCALGPVELQLVNALKMDEDWEISEDGDTTMDTYFTLRMRLNLSEDLL